MIKVVNKIITTLQGINILFMYENFDAQKLSLHFILYFSPRTRFIAVKQSVRIESDSCNLCTDIVSHKLIPDGAYDWRAFLGRMGDRIESLHSHRESSNRK